MIEVVLPKNHKDASYIKDRIKEISLRVKFIEPESGELLLRENLSEYRGIDAIHRYFEDMVVYKAEWEKFQTDSCYLDSCGNVM